VQDVVRDTQEGETTATSGQSSQGVRRERQELRQNPKEEEELALFYQLKGMPEDEAKTLAARLMAQPESALKTLGLSEPSYSNPGMAALSGHRYQRPRGRLSRSCRSSSPVATPRSFSRL
jgi:VIT family protein